MPSLISVDDYKTIKGIAANTKDDERISAVLNGVSSFVTNYCGTSIVDYYSDPLTEYYDNFYNSYIIQLNNFPIVEIESVSVKELIDTTYTLLDPSFYAIDSLTDSLFHIDSGRYTPWPSGPKAVKVTYTYGYEEVPDDLKLAIADFVFYYMNSEYKTSQTMQGGSLTGPPVVLTNPSEVPGHIKRVLDLYRNVQ